MSAETIEPELFYTGLIAQLYEPLAGELPDPDPYRRFIDLYGGPTLELGCGSGRPLLDLLEQGYDVQGLDASQDILDVCLDNAHRRNLRPVLHRGLFQSFNLKLRYQTIYIPSASFTLLTSDEDAQATLSCVAKHLLPGGAVYIPLEFPDLQAAQKSLNHFRQTIDEEGNTLRVGVIGVESTADERDMTLILRYEKTGTDGTKQSLERRWHRRSWSPKQMQPLFENAGFGRIKMLPKDFEPPQRQFVMIAELDAGR